MPAAEARDAATVILLRDAAPIEVLMIARGPSVRVMGGVWAFPGGVAEPRDGAGEDRLRAAALRELAEETSIASIDRQDLVLFSRWITPVSLPVRFDTRFFLARAPADAEPLVDGVECVDAGWFAPARVLDEPDFRLLFATRTHLERLAGFESVAALLHEARSAGPVAPTRPRLLTPGDPAGPLLPGASGYEQATG